MSSRGAVGVSVLRLIPLAVALVACAEDPPCQDAAIIQTEPWDDGQKFTSCRLLVQPGAQTDAVLTEFPTYEFSDPPVFTMNPWSCPDLDVVPPSKKRRQCSVSFGPTPTSCFMDGGCFSLLFWDEPASELKKILGTDKYATRLDCDGLTVGETYYDPKAPADVIYCRSPEHGGVEKKTD